jgi:hypothetical protein
MENIEKKLDALIDVLGFDVEEFDITRAEGYDPYPVYKVTDYKLTKRIDKLPLDCRVPCVPLPIQSKAWGSIVSFVTSHRDDIIIGVNDYGDLRAILDFMERSSDE